MTADPFLDRLAAATNLAGLPDREREAVIDHVILGRPFRVIAGGMGLSKQRVQQLERRGLAMLRDSMERRVAA